MNTKYNPDIKALAKKVDAIVALVDQVPGIKPIVATGFYTHFGFLSIRLSEYFVTLSVITNGRDKDDPDPIWRRHYEENKVNKGVLWVPLDEYDCPPRSTEEVLESEEELILDDEVQLEEEVAK